MVMGTRDGLDLLDLLVLMQATSDCLHRLLDQHKSNNLMDKTVTRRALAGMLQQYFNTRLSKTTGQASSRR